MKVLYNSKTVARFDLLSTFLSLKVASSFMGL